MTIAEIPGLGRFEIDWRTAQHPTPDPGGDGWMVEIDHVWWLGDNPAHDGMTGIHVNRHALWHKMPDGRCLSEHLEMWVYDHVEYDPSDYYDDSWWE